MSTETTTTVATLTTNTATLQVYNIAGVELRVECVDVDKDKWLSTYTIPATKNASGSPIAEKTYKLEAPAEKKRARDHAAISLGRSLMSLADDVASTDATKKADVKVLTAQNEALTAKNVALEFVLDMSDVAPTEAQIALLEDKLRDKVNAKIAKAAKTAKTA